eukprot:s1182_g29.t1
MISLVLGVHSHVFIKWILHESLCTQRRFIAAASDHGNVISSKARPWTKRKAFYQDLLNVSSFREDKLRAVAKKQGVPLPKVERFAEEQGTFSGTFLCRYR